MGEAILRLRDISLSFKGLRALSNLSFDVDAGEICALIGPNGAGKSSLLNVICGVYRADDGEISFAGETLSGARPLAVARRGISRTFQHNALFKHLSVADNVMAGLTRHASANIVEHAFRLPRARAEERAFLKRVLSVLHLLGIAQYADAVVATLPYGVQKRVDFARALVSSPQLLLLDEPLAGMNHDEKREMTHFIRDVNERLGVTVILIEHDIGVVLGLSHHVLVLDYGRLVGDGTPDQVRSSPDVIAAYLGTVH
jgi:branched-chain amino acid transport system ATP-binding protein